jgi:hypothetical protein
MAQDSEMVLYIGTYPAKPQLAPTLTSSRTSTRSMLSAPTTPPS